MAASQDELDGALVAAVTGRDADAVKDRLAEGADPNASGPDGLPLLCAAVAGFDHDTVMALTESGADAGAGLPDGTTPLVRAVDLGSPALVRSLLDDAPRQRLSDAEQKRLLDLARHWYETGAEEELRRRTGDAGPATRRTVEDLGYDCVEEVSLGGLTVRAGHSGVLTLLQAAFDVLPTVAELAARALRYPDETHVNWSEVTHILSRSRSPEVRSALTGLRDHPDPLHRLFLADVVWGRVWWASFAGRPVGEDLDFLASWALEESDGRVLAKILDCYTNEVHAARESIGLRLMAHPDPRVRREVPYCWSGDAGPLSEAGTAALLVMTRDPDPEVREVVAGCFSSRYDLDPAVREALLTLIQDSEPGVRGSAAATLSHSTDRTSEVAEALAALMREEDQQLRLAGAFGLALRDDPRTEQAYDLVGPLGPEFEHDHRPGGLWRYRSRQRGDT
ncbi:HEAT repeat domain-containing protein [Streptomyces sp. NPDC020917]|uniref:HEAT repeat domain-containing protein n=1 Tax=Streptomyces sp. NPDC020917 TaxID=3365102 RepID=UPI003798A09A